MLITFNILTYDKIIQFEQTLVTQIRAQNTSQVVYMSSSFWLLALGSRDLSQAEKERTFYKARQILKNDNYFHSKWF